MPTTPPAQPVDRPQLRALVRPFPPKMVVTKKTGGGDMETVPHHIIGQRLLHVLGGFSFEEVPGSREYDDLPVVPPGQSGPQGSARRRNGAPAIKHALTGSTFRLTLVIDGRTCIYEEAGACEDPYNWPHNGARLKVVASDAFKRCAMRAGVGLHLWAGKRFYLTEALKLDADAAAAEEEAARHDPSPDPDDPDHEWPSQTPAADAIRRAARERAGLEPEPERSGPLLPGYEYERPVPVRVPKPRQPERLPDDLSTAHRALKDADMAPEVTEVTDNDVQVLDVAETSGIPGDTGEVRPVLELVELLGLGHIRHALHILRKDRDGWQKISVGDVLRLDGASLEEANQVIRAHIARKLRERQAKDDGDDPRGQQ